MLMKLIYFYQFKIYKYLIIFQLNLILTDFYSKFKFVFILLNYHQKKSKMEEKLFLIVNLRKLEITKYKN